MIKLLVIFVHVVILLVFQIILNVFVNLVGAVLAITAIVFCSLLEGDVYVWLSCDERRYYDYYSYRRTTPSPYIKEKCLESKAMIEVRQKYPARSQICLYDVIMMSFRDDPILEDLWTFVSKLNVSRFLIVGLFLLGLVDMQLLLSLIVS